MLIQDGDTVRFEIAEEDILQSIALLKDLREYCLTVDGDGKDDTIKALLTATETMSAFWCEKFGEETDNDRGYKESDRDIKADM